MIQKSAIASMFSLNIFQDLSPRRDMIDYFPNFIIVKIH